VDVIVVVLIVAVLGFAGWKLTHRGGGEIGRRHRRGDVSYRSSARAWTPTLYENCQKHLPSQLMASGESCSTGRSRP
jgi:hypothetical protein